MSNYWIALVVIAGLLLSLLCGHWDIKRRLAKLSLRRPDPTQSEFTALLSDDCDPETAKWLWDKIALYNKHTAPHPDDLIPDDLCIDEDECVDWFEDYLVLQNANIDEWPGDWPVGTPLTVRQFARYLAKKSPI